MKLLLALISIAAFGQSYDLIISGGRIVDG